MAAEDKVGCHTLGLWIAIKVRASPAIGALHIAIDDHSRLAFSQLLPNQKTETTIAFLRDAMTFYAQHGIRIRALLTSFATPAPISAFVTTSPAPTPRAPTAKPNASSKPLLRECAYVRHWTNSEERDQHLSPWLHYYDFHRPHGSLAYAPPFSRAPASAGTTS